MAALKEQLKAKSESLDAVKKELEETKKSMETKKEAYEKNVSELNAKLKETEESVKEWKERAKKTKEELEETKKEKEEAMKKEEELEKEKEYADRKQLLQDINDIDQIYSSCVTVTSRDFKDFESIASSLTTMQKNFADFQNRMDEMRKERQRDSCSRSLSPRSVDNSEAATEVALPCIKGWTCTICGIVNDTSTVVCDGCFHRHIWSVCWREGVGTSNVNSMPLKTNKSCSILLKSGSNSGGR